MLFQSETGPSALGRHRLHKSQPAEPLQEMILLHDKNFFLHGRGLDQLRLGVIRDIFEAAQNFVTVLAVV